MNTININKIIILTFLAMFVVFTGYTQELVKDSGLTKKILKEGSGEVAKEGQEVKIKAEGRLTDGSIFDSGVLTFVIGDKDMIQGFNDVLATMKKGEKCEVTIPSSLGYGEKGVKEDDEYIIPPNATLIFEIQLIKIY